MRPRLGHFVDDEIHQDFRYQKVYAFYDMKKTKISSTPLAASVRQHRKSFGFVKQD